MLTYSNWEHVTLCFSESFASLSEGLQNALWALGGVPLRHRTDRMTLAVHPDGNPEVFTQKYQALLEHYGLTGEATNPASGHENGDCEQSHRQFKRALEQTLLVRGHRDFASREEYTAFLHGVAASRMRVGGAVCGGNTELRTLPCRRLEALERRRVKVGQGSTIRVLNNVYSVPARLRGEWVEAWVGADQIEVRYASRRWCCCRVCAARISIASITATLLAGWCVSLERSRSIAIRRICSRRAGFDRRTTCSWPSNRNGPARNTCGFALGGADQRERRGRGVGPAVGHGPSRGRGNRSPVEWCHNMSMAAEVRIGPWI